MEWSEFLGAATDLGKAAGDVYQSWNGSDADEESAYLRGQIAGITQTQQQQEAADTVKIGDVEISTSSILWIIGGTLGLLAIGLGIKKLM